MRERTISQIVAEMSVVSEVASSKHDVERVHGGEPNRAPKGPKLSMAEQHAEHYSRAKTPQGREHARRIAQDALERARRQRLPTTSEPQPTPRDAQWKRSIAESPVPDGKLATLNNVSRQYIRKIREAYAADPS